MKIGFVFTNFNNSLLSIQAAKSIESNCPFSDYQIVVVDNASSDIERHLLADQDAMPEKSCVIWNKTNLGYFEGLNVGIEHLLELGSNYDAIIIGNNDLVFSFEFFEGLKKRSDILFLKSVVSPNIVTLDHIHQNPHVHIGVSRFREVVWDLYFSNFMLSKIIDWIARKGKRVFGRKDHYEHSIEREIYMGYGACYILTRNFFSKYQRLWSPGFLMGEEFYLARQLASKGEKIYYVPDILVYHHDHATMSKIPSRHLWEITRQYHRIYRFFISPYRFKMDLNKTPEDYENNLL